MSVFRITTLDGGRVLSHDGPSLSLKVPESSYTTWNFEVVKSGEQELLRISTDELPGFYLDSSTTCNPKLEKPTSHTTPPGSGWKFEKLDDLVPARLEQGRFSKKESAGLSFQDKFFNLSLEEACWEEYDIIIVGSGIGGGVLANDLYDTNLRRGKKAKRVLLLEKGGLVFHSHCLNTARPAGLANDRGQQNDTFFKDFKSGFKFTGDLKQEDSRIPSNPSHPMKQSPWSGGPMYNLGGRSAAWGLFSPRIHNTVLEKWFHKDVDKQLRDEYYDKAERLMLLSLPTTRRVHQHVMDRLDSKCREVIDTNVQWHWGRIASEFKDDQNFDFAEGAYSTIDKILEIAMSRPKVKYGEEDVLVEHKYFKTVINADVRSLEFNSNKTCTGVKVRGPKGDVIIKLRNPGRPDDQEDPEAREAHGKVVLCAGSVDSPAILLRSGLSDKVLREKYNGLHLTDHTILFFQCSFRYTDPAKRSEYGAMKLQTYARIENKIVLVNMSIDASSFLPRGKSPDGNLPKCIIVFMLQQELDTNNTINLVDEVPHITLNPRKKKSIAEGTMRRFTLAAMKALVGSAGLEFVDFEGLKSDSNDPKDDDYLDNIQLGFLPLGGVAHELGTLPMRGKNNPDEYCLDQNLCVRKELCQGAYVCDLSCFPHSPAANPTLTLAALSIRLSRHLVKRLNVPVKVQGELERDYAYVQTVNHSGAKIKVFLSHYIPNKENGDAGSAEPLEPGDDKCWLRPKGVPQGLFVYKLDRSKEVETFLDEPVVLVAHPGKITPILAD